LYSFFFCVVVLGFELRASGLLARLCTSRVTTTHIFSTSLSRSSVLSSNPLNILIIVLANSGHYKIPQARLTYTLDIYFSYFWNLEAQNHCAGWFDFYWGPSFLLYTYMLERKREIISLMSLLVWAQIPFMMALPSTSQGPASKYHYRRD
jgi:hypothetical protein